MKYQTKEELDKASDSHLAEMRDYSAGRIIKSRFGINLVDKYFGPNKNSIFLDCGPAEGVFSEQLLEAGYKKIFAVDLGDYLGSETKKKLAGFGLADFNRDKLPWSEAGFDAAIAWCILPHLENPHNFIREVYRVLRPNGMFFLSMPNIFSLASRLNFLRYGDVLRYKAKKNHISIFTKAVFYTTVLKYFDLVEKDYFIKEDALGRGFRGFVNRAALLLRPFLNQYPKLKELFGYNIVYVLRKK